MNQWNGKLWYAYGTSMTNVQQGEYVPVVEKLSGMKVVNFGIPGGSLTPDGLGRKNQAFKRRFGSLIFLLFYLFLAKNELFNAQKGEFG